MSGIVYDDETGGLRKGTLIGREKLDSSLEYDIFETAFLIMKQVRGYEAYVLDKKYPAYRSAG